MKQLKKNLMLCLILALTCAATARLYAETAKTQSEGAPVVIIKKPGKPISDAPRTPAVVPISAMVNGSTLYVTFTGDLGLVDYELDNLNTTELVTDQIEGTGLVLIPFSGDSGSYTITFTLSNGVQFYGEFTL